MPKLERYLNSKLCLLFWKRIAHFVCMRFHTAQNRCAHSTQHSSTSPNWPPSLLHQQQWKSLIHTDQHRHQQATRLDCTWTMGSRSVRPPNGLFTIVRTITQLRTPTPQKSCYKKYIQTNMQLMSIAFKFRSSNQMKMTVDCMRLLLQIPCWIAKPGIRIYDQTVMRSEYNHRSKLQSLVWFLSFDRIAMLYKTSYKFDRFFEFEYCM